MPVVSGHPDGTSIACNPRLGQRTFLTNGSTGLKLTLNATPVLLYVFPVLLLLFVQVAACAAFVVGAFSFVFCCSFRFCCLYCCFCCIALLLLCCCFVASLLLLCCCCCGCFQVADQSVLFLTFQNVCTVFPVVWCCLCC